jgi:hypothetical protein
MWFRYWVFCHVVCDVAAVVAALFAAVRGVIYLADRGGPWAAREGDDPE